MYWGGKRLEADDDNKIYRIDGKYYLVNSSGKIQKSSSKKYDIEDNGTDLYVKFGSGDTIEWIYTDKELTNPIEEMVYEWPHIALYDTGWSEKPKTTTAVNEDSFLGIAVAE